MSKTLLELCEPMFAYVCKLNRIARRDLSYSKDVASVEIRKIFEEMRSRANEEPGLRSQFDRMELALRAFVDESIQRSELSFAEDWEPISWEMPDGAAYLSSFFESLDETLEERGREAQERMEVFYTCLGLGFAPEERSPEQIDEYQTRLAAHVCAPGATTERRISSPEDHKPDTRVLWVRLGMPLTIIAASVVIGLIALYAVNVVIYERGLHDLEASLGTINEPSEVAE